MKSLKFLAAVAVIAAALAQQASAQTHIYISGSTAFRSAAIAAIGAVTHLGNTAGTNGIVSGGGTGNDTTYTNATPPAGTATNGTQNTTFIWQGGFITNADNSTTSVTVCASFTGSQSGIATVTGSLAIPFLPDGSTGTANPSAYADAQGATPNITSQSYLDNNGVSHNGFYATTVQNVPSFAFSDVFQGTSAFNGSVKIGVPFFVRPTAHTFVSGIDHQVGFVTFKWLASANFPLGATGATNVNEGTVFGSGYRVSSINFDINTMHVLFSNGSVSLAMLTGNSSDNETVIYATGRNPDSGTRGCYLSDTLYGNLNTVVQYQPINVQGGVVATMQKYPVETIAGLNTGSSGNSGEATGATLRAYLPFTLNAGANLTLIDPTTSSSTPQSANVTAAYLLTALGTADAGNAAVIGKATELTYNGVPFSLNAIYAGQYTLWEIEHIYDRGDLTGTVAQTETNVISNLQTTPTAGLSKAGISNLDIYNPVSNPTGPFQATRTTDTPPVTPTFTP